MTKYIKKTQKKQRQLQQKNTCSSHIVDNKLIYLLYKKSSSIRKGPEEEDTVHRKEIKVDLKLMSDPYVQPHYWRKM